MGSEELARSAWTAPSALTASIVSQALVTLLTEKQSEAFQVGVMLLLKSVLSKAGVAERPEARAHMELLSRARQVADSGFESLNACLARHSGRLKAAPGQAPINATQYQVLSLLLARAKPGCWPVMTLAELAKLAGRGQRAVRYAIANLEGRGLLKRVSLPGRASTYDLSGLVEQLQAMEVAA